MFNHKLKGKILIVFSDPGGAKPCLAIASTLDQSNLVIVSDREYTFYKDFDLKVISIGSSTELGKIIDRFGPELIFTGTSYTSTIEKVAIALAKKKNLRVFSFVDHWTSILDRFKNDKGVLIFPNEVWVVDERAMKIAIDEGIKPEDLYVSGNPYHEWLKLWRPKTTYRLFFESIAVNQKKSIILFAPDPLSNINGIKVYGYDEYSMARKMVHCVRKSSTEFKTSFHFLIKMHPNQATQKLEKIFSGESNFTVLPKEFDTNESIFFSDLVIGFFSSILIEADLMGKPIIRFIGKESKKDPFLGLNVGIIANEDNLIDNILQIHPVKWI